MHPTIARARRSPDVSHRSPVRLNELLAELERQSVSLPEAHLQFLADSDGAETYGGYFRIFGGVALIEWNARETWRFAWPSVLDEYFFFGETAWGDQYAYRVADMRLGADPPVYYLDAIMMSEGKGKLASSFVDFIENDFLRNSVAPYDEILVEARKKYGDLDVTQHIIYAPSPLITGAEHLEHVIVMPARAAMIANGDLATQLGDELQSRPIRGIEPYEDELGRTRLKVIW
jgi:hypothetical protein